MKCYRLDLRRKYSSYIHGRLLPVSKAKKVEEHLAICAACNGLVERMRTVERLISELPSVSPGRNLWPGIVAALPLGGREHSSFLWKRVAIVAVVGLISGVLGAVTYGKISDRGLKLNSPVRLEEFSSVPIGRIPNSTEPHIVTEGYVSEVRLNGEDGDRIFKLVDDLHRPGPFVICELIDPLDLPAPPVGSRVRVYGVSRYDNKTDHEWHEVHPVLNIEILKQ